MATKPGPAPTGLPSPVDITVGGKSLTDTQKAAVVNWIAQVWNYYNATPPSGFQSDSDVNLLALLASTKTLYSTGEAPVANDPINSTAGAIAGAGVNAANAITAPLDFLKLLANPELWVRVAEVAVGALLLGIGVNAFLKETTGINPGKAAVKTAGAAALA